MWVVVSAGHIAVGALSFMVDVPPQFSMWAVRRYYEAHMLCTEKISDEDANRFISGEIKDPWQLVTLTREDLGGNPKYKLAVEWLSSRYTSSTVAISRFNSKSDVFALNVERAFPALPWGQSTEIVADWLHSTEPSETRLHAKLDKMTWAQAQEHAERWHARMAKLKPCEIGDPNAVEVVREFDVGIKAVRILTQAGADYEGAMMRHCVGHAGYVARSLIYSVRDAMNVPWATLEVRMDKIHTTAPPGSKTLTVRRVCVNQIKGPGNGPVPPEFRPAVIGLLEDLNPRVVCDLDKIGCVSVGNAFVDVTAADAPSDEAFLKRLFKNANPIAVRHALQVAKASPHVIEAARRFVAPREQIDGCESVWMAA